MENQEKLTLLDKVQEVIELAFEYQNKGIGTAMVSFYGHIKNVDVRLYDGGWNELTKPTAVSFYTDDKDDANEAINKLKSIIANAPTKEEAERIRKEKELADKKAQLERLAKELNVKIVG